MSTYHRAQDIGVLGYKAQHVGLSGLRFKVVVPYTFGGELGPYMTTFEPEYLLYRYAEPPTLIVTPQNTATVVKPRSGPPIGRHATKQVTCKRLYRTLEHSLMMHRILPTCPYIIRQRRITCL